MGNDHGVEYLLSHNMGILNTTYLANDWTNIDERGLIRIDVAACNQFCYFFEEKKIMSSLAIHCASPKAKKNNLKETS